MIRTPYIAFYTLIFCRFVPVCTLYSVFVSDLCNVYKLFGVEVSVIFEVYSVLRSIISGGPFKMRFHSNIVEIFIYLVILVLYFV